MNVPVPGAATNVARDVPSTTAMKIVCAPPMVSVADSDVPWKRATKPLPDQEKRGCAASDAVSTRPIQRTPAATTPAGGGDGLLPPSGGGGGVASCEL